MTPITILHEAEIELWETVQFHENRCPGLDSEREIVESRCFVLVSPVAWAFSP
jgi:hypothetical protein